MLAGLPALAGAAAQPLSETGRIVIIGGDSAGGADSKFGAGTVVKALLLSAPYCLNGLPVGSADEVCDDVTKRHADGNQTTQHVKSDLPPVTLLFFSVLATLPAWKRHT